VVTEQAREEKAILNGKRLDKSQKKREKKKKSGQAAFSKGQRRKSATDRRRFSEVSSGKLRERKIKKSGH